MLPNEHQGPWRNAKIERISQLTPRIKSFFLDVSALASRRAGQHIDVRLTAPDGYAAQRSYSIASAPRADNVEIIIEKLQDGEVSPFSMTSRRWARVSKCVGRSVDISSGDPPMAGRCC
jgi:ferredoxin-NADP reductase